MKREEKNQITRRRIVDSALKEFAEKGYGASSVNNICNGENFSKGIIYHYFQTKDELYLECVSECFYKLKEFLKNAQLSDNPTVQMQLQSYFDARMKFFQSYPMYQKIFCEAVFVPPSHLAEAIKEKRADFDAQNILILEEIICGLKLRPGISKDMIVLLFGWLQDYVNAKYKGAENLEIDFRTHEEECQMALDILLYGVIERKEEV